MSLLKRDSDGRVMPVLAVGTTQKKAFTGTSAAIDNPISGDCNVVRLLATTDCHVAFGTAPTATTSSMPLTANIPEIVAVVPGSKVAAIQQSEGGDLYVTELV